MKIKKWWHTHNFIPKEVKYPVIIRYNPHAFGAPYSMDQEERSVGTAIFYECECGQKKVLQMIGVRKIWHDAIIKVKGSI